MAGITQKTINLTKHLHSKMQQVVYNSDMNMSQLVRISIRHAKPELLCKQQANYLKGGCLRTTINLKPYEEALLYSLMSETGLLMSTVIRAAIITFLSEEEG